MPKKKTPSKETAKSEEIPAEQESANPPHKANKSRNEIDEIFSVKKRKKSDQEKAAAAADKSDEKDADAEGKPGKAKKKKKRVKKDDGFVNPQPSGSTKPRKKTHDGLTLYTEEELGFGKSDAGGTPLCPFDCSCCF